MSEAPERIWAWWDDTYDVGLLNKHGDKRYTPNDAKEYVRADRIEELEAKLSESEALLAKAVRLISEKPILATYEDDVQWQKYVIAELTSSEAANGEAKGGKDE